MSLKKIQLILVFAIVYCADSEKNQPNSLLPKTCGIHSIPRKEKTIGCVATIGEFPWAVLLDYLTPDGYLGGCAGSLVTNRHVLTAAQCVLDLPSDLNLQRVRLGEHDPKTDPDCESGNFCSDPVLTVPIEMIIGHEKFGKVGRYANDVALLRLSREIEFTRYIQPICLPSGPELGQRYWYAGWGKIAIATYPNTKHKLELPFVDFGSCSKSYISHRHVTIGEDQFCAGGETGRSTCEGDAGAPLMREVVANGSGFYVLDGIVSFGPGVCGLSNWPDTFTKVCDHMPWIMNKLDSEYQVLWDTKFNDKTRQPPKFKIEGPIGPPKLIIGGHKTSPPKLMIGGHKNSSRKFIIGGPKTSLPQTMIPPGGIKISPPGPGVKIDYNYRSKG